MFKDFHYRFSEVRPTAKALSRVLQMPDLSVMPEILPVVSSICEQMEDSEEIVGGYTIVPCTGVDIHKGEVYSGDNVLMTGRRISAYMKESEELALFVCTAGALFTKISHEYQYKGDLLESYIVDSLGSITVENAMDKVQKSLMNTMIGYGNKITNRYSPGYCEWSVQGQKKLFEMIGHHTTGVTLTDSCLMQPIKSVSGIIGIGPNVKKREYGCAICTSKTCVYRRIIHS